MSENHHPEQLEEFVAGRLGEEESAAVLAHLEGCDECFARSERLWRELAPAQLTAEVPVPGPEVAERVEDRFLRRMHLSDLASQTIRMWTQGLGAVVLALLRPFFSRSNGSRPGDRR